MDKIEKLIQRVQKTQHDFLYIQNTADKVVERKTAEESLRIAKQLFASDVVQARSPATFILGRLTANSPESLE